MNVFLILILIALIIALFNIMAEKKIRPEITSPCC